VAELEPGDVIVSLTTGATGLVMPREGADETSMPQAITRGGLIYTDRRDMPSLEELLAEHHIASAVVLRDAPPSVTPLRLIGATALASAISAVGAALLVVDAAGSAHPNPYIALMLFLGGLGLLATVLIATRS
jgi:hypothetical protein